MKKNNKKESNKIYIYIFLLVLCIVLSIIIYFFVKNNNKSENNEEDDLEDDVVESSIKPFENTERINISIDGKEYEMVLENNLSAFDLINVSPIEMHMEDLNNNEKYYYLGFSLSDSDIYTGKINKGDVMLYQSNCIVIFYKDYDAPYEYIKLGHISGLEDFDNNPINVRIYN